jgi:hypothetical protein
MNDRANQRRNDGTGDGENLMDCAQFEEIVHELDRPGTEGAALRESALAHAESCSRCAQLLTETKALNLALRALAAQEADQQALPRLEGVLVQEFRREKAAAGGRRVRWQVAALGIAAAALLAFGLSMHQRPVKPGVVAEQPSAPSQPGPAAGAADQSQPAEADDWSDFVPLPYGADPVAAEEGAVVRVALSRVSLASLGVSLTAMESEDPVLADLVVSEDGTPQAIRLVSEENASREF